MAQHKLKAVLWASAGPLLRLFCSELNLFPFICEHSPISNVVYVVKKKPCAQNMSVRPSPARNHISATILFVCRIFTKVGTEVLHKKRLSRKLELRKIGNLTDIIHTGTLISSYHLAFHIRWLILVKCGTDGLQTLLLRNCELGGIDIEKDTLHVGRKHNNFALLSIYFVRFG